MTYNTSFNSGQLYRPSGSRRKHRRQEHDIDMDLMSRLRHIFRYLPAAQFSKRALDSRIFCGPFKVFLKVYGKEIPITDAQNELIEEKYMNTLHEIQDWLDMFGFCPYMWCSVDELRYPVVPQWGTFNITYEVTRSETVFRLYWIDDNGVQKEAKRIFWIKGDDSPDGGEFRSKMSAVLNLYLLQKFNITYLMKATEEAANPFIIFEHHPQGKIDLEKWNSLREAYGDKRAWDQMNIAEDFREAIRIRQNTALQGHLNNSMSLHTKPNIFDNNENGSNMRSNASQTYNKFSTRSITTSPDYVTKTGPKPSILMDIETIWRKVSYDCASIMGFPIEFAQPQNAARSSNIEIAQRFLNETVKSARRKMQSIVKRMWLTAYGPLHLSLENDLKQRSVRNLSLSSCMELYSKIDINIEWQCVPEHGYNTLRQLTIDKVIDHNAFKSLTQGLFGIPKHLLMKSQAETVFLLEEREVLIREQGVVNAQMSLRSANNTSQRADIHDSVNRDRIDSSEECKRKSRNDEGSDVAKDTVNEETTPKRVANEESSLRKIPARKKSKLTRSTRNTNGPRPDKIRRGVQK